MLLYVLNVKPVFHLVVESSSIYLTNVLGHIYISTGDWFYSSVSFGLEFMPICSGWHSEKAPQ